MTAFVSLVDVQGKSLVQDFIGSALPFDLPCSTLDRTHMEFGRATFEVLPTDYNGAAKVLSGNCLHTASNRIVAIG
jgi:hypothetical protein